MAPKKTWSRRGLGGGVDHFGVGEAAVEEAEAAVDLAQAALAFLVVGVLAAVTVAGGPGDDLDHAVPLGAALGELAAEAFVAGGRHVELAAGQARRAVRFVIIVVHAKE